MAEPVSVVASIAVAIVAAERIITEVRRRRAQSNGAAPFTVGGAATMEAELLVAIEKNASAMRDHVKTNAKEHADLHSRVTRVAEGVARLEGRNEGMAGV